MQADIQTDKMCMQEEEADIQTSRQTDILSHRQIYTYRVLLRCY